MTYEPKTWADGQQGGTPITASDLNHIEGGIYQAHVLCSDLETGKLTKTLNLSDLTSASTARTNLGLGGSSTLNIGTTAGTVTAGDDTRITGAAQKSANLSDLANSSTSRSNLGLGSSSVLNIGTGSGTVAAGDDSRITGAAQKTSNLSDISSPTTALTNIGGFPSTGGTVNGHLNVTGNALGIATPEQHDAIAWAFDPACINDSSSVSNGVLYLVAMYVPKDATCTKIWWAVQTAGLLPTSNQNHVGLYNSSGTLLASVNTDAQSAAGVHSATISSQNLTPGTYWVGLLSNYTTPPAWARGSTLSSALTSMNQSGASCRFASNGTGRSSMPSSITMGSNAAAQSFWAAIS